jgi:DNA-binding SARP family transcriptional activator
VRFSLLGPLQVTGEDGTPVEVRGMLRRTLLAELLPNAGSVVSADHLAELLWASDAAGGRGARPHNQIARLRQDLGDAGAQRVKAAPPGYLV